MNVNIDKTAMDALDELFSKDCIFALATTNTSRPAVRSVDTYYEDGAFYIVTSANSAKVRDFEICNKVAMCSQAYRFEGLARNIGHPLAAENSVIREKLIQVFAPWYFKHNNENDSAMCYVKIELQHGFFYKDGTGYNIDFDKKTVESFPFTLDIVFPE